MNVKTSKNDNNKNSNLLTFTFQPQSQYESGATLTSHENIPGPFTPNVIELNVDVNVY